MKQAMMLTVLMVLGLNANADVLVANPTFLDGVLAWIPAHAAAVASGLGVLEVVLRLVPSQKALSILVPVKYALNGLGTICTWAGGIVDTLASQFNNVKS